MPEMIGRGTLPIQETVDVLKDFYVPKDKPRIISDFTRNIEKMKNLFNANKLDEQHNHYIIRQGHIPFAEGMASDAAPAVPNRNVMFVVALYGTPSLDIEQGTVVFSGGDILKTVADNNVRQLHIMVNTIMPSILHRTQVVSMSDPTNMTQQVINTEIKANNTITARLMKDDFQEGKHAVSDADFTRITQYNKECTGVAYISLSPIELKRSTAPYNLVYSLIVRAIRMVE